MKILVTGGAGFIASHVVDAYIDGGHDVVVIDDLSSGKRENLNPKAKFYECDIRSKEVGEIFKGERPDAVNHHAAQMSVPASVEDPLLDADINIKGLINILESAKECGTKKVIFVSSGGAVYGEADEYPTTETYPPKPLSPYAISKYAGEHYLSFYGRRYGMEHIVLRYSNVYGPRQIPHGEAGVVAIFMENLIHGRSSTLYHFDGEPRGMTRDYCYVGDVAVANVAVLKEGISGVFNIGTGVETYTEDLFNIIFKAAAKEIPGLSLELGRPGKGAARHGDIKKSCLDASKAAEELGWRGETGLEDGILSTLKWLRDTYKR